MWWRHFYPKKAWIKLLLKGHLSLEVLTMEELFHLEYEISQRMYKKEEIAYMTYRHDAFQRNMYLRYEPLGVLWQKIIDRQYFIMEKHERNMAQRHVHHVKSIDALKLRLLTPGQKQLMRMMKYVRTKYNRDMTIQEKMSCQWPPPVNASEHLQREMALRVLGLNQFISKHEIERTWKKLALLFYPDRNPIAEQTFFNILFKNITEAKNILVM